MEQYKNYEYWIDKEHCKYGLAISVNSCRQCLFNALCCYEKNQERIKEKEKSDLSDNNDK